MSAVDKALAAFKNILNERPSDKLLVLVDNTSTRDVLAKGTAREYLFNGALNEALRKLQGDRITTVAHIPTLSNYSDPLSRGKARYTEQELKQLQSTLGALGGRLAEAALMVRVPAARG